MSEHVSGNLNLKDFAIHVPSNEIYLHGFTIVLSFRVCSYQINNKYVFEMVFKGLKKC